MTEQRTIFDKTHAEPASIQAESREQYLADLQASLRTVETACGSLMLIRGYAAGPELADQVAVIGRAVLAEIERASAMTPAQFSASQQERATAD